MLNTVIVILWWPALVTSTERDFKVAGKPHCRGDTEDSGPDFAIRAEWLLAREARHRASELLYDTLFLAHGFRHIDPLEGDHPLVARIEFLIVLEYQVHKLIPVDEPEVALAEREVHCLFGE